MKFGTFINGQGYDCISKEVGVLIYRECEDKGMCITKGGEASVVWERYYSKYIDAIVEFMWDSNDGSFIGIKANESYIVDLLCLAHNELRYNARRYAVEEREDKMGEIVHKESYEHPELGKFVVTWVGGELDSVNVAE